MISGQSWGAGKATLLTVCISNSHIRVRGSKSPKITISPFSPCDIQHIYIIAVSIKDIAYCNPFMTSWTSPSLSIKFSLYSFTVWRIGCRTTRVPVCSPGCRRGAPSD